MSTALVVRKLVKPAAKDSAVPTHHLYVSGLGTAFGHSAADVAALLHLDMTAVARVDLVADAKRFVYVSFASTDAAARVHHAVQAEGKFHVSYAVEERRGPGKAPEPACTSATAHVNVPGVHVLPAFITAAEEKALLDVLGGDDAPWEDHPAYMPSAAGSGNESRRVQHYGAAAFNYSTLYADDRPAHLQPMPALCASLVERIVADALATDTAPPSLTQLTINEYKVGEGIGAHIDTYGCFGNDILVINLGSGIVMTLQKRVTLDDAATAHPSVRTHCRNNRLRPTVEGDDYCGGEGEGEAEEQPVGTKKHVYLPRRSLLLLSGEGRYLYSHGIAKRVSDKVDGVLMRRGVRISLTFRSIL
jgi:alkylated DNA repair protein alkB family protein 8